ncbi:MAG: hypothetical protein ACRCYQ_07390 [Nocardioides sp.]
MIVHLGRRVSALLDGQLSQAEAERAWQHVHLCYACRDLVEREGRLKTQLAGLARGNDYVPAYLKGSLLGAISSLESTSPTVAVEQARRAQLRMLGAFVGAGAVGMALLALMALNLSDFDTDDPSTPLPVTDFGEPSESFPAPTQSADPLPSSVSPTIPVASMAAVRGVRSGHHFARLAVHAVK